MFYNMLFHYHIQAYDGKPKVFFDILGYVFISYTKDVGVIVNVLVAILAVLIPYFFFSQSTKGIYFENIKHSIGISHFFFCL